MLKIENTEIFGWEAAVRGMRNPMNSWNKSDGYWTVPDHHEDSPQRWAYRIGENDLKLMKNLSKAGPDHGKFLRMINVTLDITAPLYWWKEFDTYKVGTTANSCSTMHKLTEKEFTLDDFSHEHLDDEEVVWMDSDIGMYNSLDILEITIDALNYWRNKYLKAKTKPMKEEVKRSVLMKRYWWQMIQLLPSSYNQKRTVQLNYQVLKNMYFSRRHHKLDEWHTLCDWMETLPYFKEVCIEP